MTANKNEKLIKEYKTIEADTAILENYSFNAARQNSAKNRYSNIHPFDHNRVVLSMDDGDTDYINASHIDVSMKVESKRKGNPVKVIKRHITSSVTRFSMFKKLLRATTFKLQMKSMENGTGPKIFNQDELHTYF